jgi:acyl carrier protein
MDSIAEQLVSKAIVDVNQQSSDGPRIADDRNTRLLGDDGVIDSLAFAFLIVTIEQYALDDLNKEIVIFDDEVMEMDFDADNNPFTTVGSLITFVSNKLR